MYYYTIPDTITILKMEPKCRMKGKRRSTYKKILYKYSSPKQAQKMAHKYLGKTAKLYPASNPEKKYRIYDPKNDKWVNFLYVSIERACEEWLETESITKTPPVWCRLGLPLSRPALCAEQLDVLVFFSDSI